MCRVRQEDIARCRSFWMSVITRLLMVMLEKRCPGGWGQLIFRRGTLDLNTRHPQFWRASPLRVLPPERINKVKCDAESAGERDIGLSVAVDVAIDSDVAPG